MRCVDLLGMAVLSVLGPQVVRAQDLSQQLSTVVQTYMSQDDIPGVMVGVWQGDAQIAYVGEGLSDLSGTTPISENDQFKIGSVTKSMTTTLILQLADQGLVNLDNPVSDYISGLSGTMSSATLRQLANMTSGIPDYTSTGSFTTALAAILPPDPPGTGTPTGTFTDSQLVGYASTAPQIYPPGKGPWNYSNTNTVLLGMVVAKVTGLPLQTAMNNMFTTLGMANTIYPDPSSSSLVGPSILHGYNTRTDQINNDVSHALPSSMFSGAGAVFSTLDDLAIWGRALGQGTLIKADMQAQRLTFVVAGDSAGTSTGMPYYDAYGLGIGSIDGWIGHTGDQPGYEDLVLYDPSTDRTIVIVDNLGLGDNHNYPTDMFLAMQSILAVPEPSMGVLALLGITILGLTSRKLKKKS